MYLCVVVINHNATTSIINIFKIAIKGLINSPHFQEIIS